jgi:glycosyltransferase involved in cell wall biosynthesis
LSGRVFSAKQRIYQSAERRIQFVTPSAWLKEQALKSAAPTLQQKEAIAVIPNPIDTTYFYPKDDALVSGDVVTTTNTPSPNQTEAAEEKPFVLMFAAANLGNVAKGFAEFQSICNALHDAGKRRIHALVVGENRLGNLRELGLRCDYSELGFIANAQAMREAYWQSDVYVTTSHEENLPTTIMESLSCGVPVAAFAVGGIPEMIQSDGPGQTGWLAPKLAIQPLVESLLQYSLTSATERVALKARCRQAAIANYGAKSIAGQYLRLYQQN